MPPLPQSLFFSTLYSQENEEEEKNRAKPFGATCMHLSC